MPSVTYPENLPNIDLFQTARYGYPIHTSLSEGCGDLKTRCISGLVFVPDILRLISSTRAWMSASPYWGRRLHRWRWRPVLAGLFLRQSLREDLPVAPAPSAFGELGLRYRSRWLCWWRRRPVVASLLLRWSLWRDLIRDLPAALAAPSRRLNAQLGR